jgi:hypothetical protein
MIIKQHNTLIQQSEAHFDAISFLMLNPSTANEVDNDPTIERCQRRAIAMGYGSMIIVNLFPFRMTDSTQLNTVNNLLGDASEADNCILRAVQASAMTVCGWGKHPLAVPRGQAVILKLKNARLQDKVKCLQLNADNSPQHPLYIAYAKQPVPFVIT